MDNVFVEFSCYRDNMQGPQLGPFPFVQVTYDRLRVGPDGNDLAVLGSDGDWHLVGADWGTQAGPWSDIVINTHGKENDHDPRQ